MTLPTHPAAPFKNRSLSILHLEDNPLDCELIHQILESHGFTFKMTYARTQLEFESALDQQPYDLILSDFTLPSYGGIPALAVAQEKQPATPYIFVSGTIGEERAVESMKSGATDYVLKHHLHRLGPIVERALLQALDRQERQRAEEALRQANLTLQLALQASNIGPWDWNLLTNEVYLSPEWKRQLGFLDEEIPNQFSEWEGRLHPQDRDRVLSALDAIRTQPDARHEIEFRLRHKEGSYRWILTRAKLLHDSQGRGVRIIGCHLDVTEHKQRALQTMRAQRLEAIGSVAAGIAHDLNNTLTPIMMGLEMLRLQYPTETQILEMFEASARHSADMVGQLLMFTRGTEGDRHTLQPASLLLELENILKASLPKSIEFHTRLDPNLPWLRCDATQVQRVLLNLCVNARDAMPNGGTLSIKVLATDVDAPLANTILTSKPGPYVVFQVCDSGAGIPPDILHHIFEPFFTTKGHEKGTGLGLTTVLGIVKSHGGFLQVESKPGHGSCFRVFLPAILPA
jgi:PAS domain S-box-containing protein